MTSHHKGRSGARTANWAVWVVIGAWWSVFIGPTTLAAIIISEVMYDPQNSDVNREWVEIYNTGSTSVNLGGWQFGRPNASQWTSAFPGGTTLGANQAMVITPSISTFDSDWGTGKNRIQVGSFPSLLDAPTGTAGRIALRDSSGVIQNEITYTNGSGWPNIGGNDGHSIYVLPQHLSNTANGSNWRPSSQGVYGAYWRGAGGDSENHASPGFVSTQQQSPFTPSPDAVWSMVVLPDTQNYVARSQFHLDVLQGQMNWIANNKDAFNIQVVLQEGDIVNRNSGTADNGVTAVQQWQRARDAFSTLNGVVPYIMATGNHDYGTTNAQTRDTKFNTYFKAADNPLTAGILQGTMSPGELQNAYYEFTAPDGRDMLIFSLEFWPRDNVVNWAKSIAQQPQYADHTAVLLSHSIVNSGGNYWRTNDESYAMEGGNDGLDLWNKLMKVAGNFEMSFNGHVGGDGVDYRVDKSNAGDDVHQMILNTQFETNAGNGWLRVLEFLEDGKTVRVRTYSPHFDLYRTNAANQFNITLSQVVAGDTLLVWNHPGGGAESFEVGFATGDGQQGIDAFPANPWASPYNTGRQQLLVGYDGAATLSGSSSRTIGALRIGTDQADAVIAGRNGDGAVTASGTGNLVLASGSNSAGDLIVGEGGFEGVINWDSSGTLEAQGRLRVGQGGVGTFNQTSGIVIGGNMPGSFLFIGIGAAANSEGIYNLSNGFLRPSGGFAGSEFRQTIVGDNGGVGVLNAGDDVGVPNTAVLQSNDDLIIGRNGGAGLLQVRSDGRVELRTNSNPAQLIVGENGDGDVLQTGGSVLSDDLVRIGSGSNGNGLYAISGGSLSTATDGSGSFQIARAGAVGKLQISGTATVIHGAELAVVAEPNAGGEGRLEIIGSSASVQIGQLDNAVGGNETIFWQAAPAGLTPVVITGAGPLTHHVQLQNPAEALANIDVGAGLLGDGIALSIDLAALSGSQTLTLVDNRTDQPITGFFENGSSGQLYEEGALVLGTGFNGTVSISYVGSSGVGSLGNDIVLNLEATISENADFDADGDVDGNDFLTWQQHTGISNGASLNQGDANGDGSVDHVDFNVWSQQFTSQPQPTAAVPEPNSVASLALFAAICSARWRRLHGTGFPLLIS